MSTNSDRNPDGFRTSVGTFLTVFVHSKISGMNNRPLADFVRFII